MMAAGLPSRHADYSLCKADHLVKPRMNPYYEEPENNVQGSRLLSAQTRTTLLSEQFWTSHF